MSTTINTANSASGYGGELTKVAQQQAASAAARPATRQTEPREPIRTVERAAPLAQSQAAVATNTKQSKEAIAANASKEPSAQQLDQAVKKVREQVQIKAPNELVFSIDQESGRAIVSIIDQKTGETIRQVPPKEMLEISQSIEKMQGLLLREKA